MLPVDIAQVIEQSPDLYLVLTPDLRIAYANLAYCNATLITPDTAFGRTVQEVFPENPSDPSASRAFMASAAQVLQTGAPHLMEVVKYEHTRPAEAGGGTDLRFWRIGNFPVFGADGKISYILHRAQDVTEFELMKLQRQARKGGLVLFIGCADKAVADALQSEYRVETATDGRDGLEKAKSLLPDLVIGELGMPALRGDALARELLSRPETRDIPLLLIMEKEEEPLKVSLLREGVRDCIVRPFAVEELAAKAHGLVAVRRQQAAANAQLVQQLTQSNKDLEHFAYIASHDLKSPLRAISALSHWIEEDIGAAGTATLHKHLETLRRRVARMEKLLHDLLEYSRIGSKQAQAPAEIVDGRALAEDTVYLAAPPPGITVEISEGFDRIRLCRIPLQHVLLNLLTNAIKHHDKPTGNVSVNVEQRDGEYHFSVIDDGPGIAAEYHEKIFEMFQTLKPRDEKEGSGMGLAVVRKILALYRCEITVHSNGRGTEFRFTWPVNQQESDS